MQRHPIKVDAYVDTAMLTVISPGTTDVVIICGRILEARVSETESGFQHSYKKRNGNFKCTLENRAKSSPQVSIENIDVQKRLDAPRLVAEHVTRAACGS